MSDYNVVRITPNANCTGYGVQQDSVTIFGRRVGVDLQRGVPDKIDLRGFFRCQWHQLPDFKLPVGPEDLVTSGTGEPLGPGTYYYNKGQFSTQKPKPPEKPVMAITITQPQTLDKAP